MVHVKAITQPRDTRCDLVELNTLLAAICRAVRDLLQRLGGSRTHTSLANKHLEICEKGGRDMEKARSSKEDEVF
jgi:hypothetical protein